MKYHLQVDGKVVRSNIQRKLAFDFFELVKELLPGHEVSVITTKEVGVFQ